MCTLLWRAGTPDKEGVYMRKLGMAGVMAAAALFAQAARADDAAKERREAADATSAEMKQEGREMKAEAQQQGTEAQREMQEQQRETQREMAERRGEARTAAAQGEKKHPLFEGKNNFNVEGKIQKVSKNSITLQREDLPAATLSVSKDTKIELDGEQASMKQLKQGQDVKASFNLKGEKPEAVEINAEKLDTQK
jgi:hypothetical protein